MELLGGGTLLEYSDQEQKAVMQFDARPEFCHSGGKVVQGGFITAWMDAAMAHAVRQASHGESSAMTLELKVTFIAAAGPGRVCGPSAHGLPPSYPALLVSQSYHGYV